MTAEPKSLTFSRWGITFVEQQQFHNHLGNYRVNSIVGNMMFVEYLDGERKGTIQQLEAIGQAKVIHNQRIRELEALRMSELNLHGPNNTFTLGYLSQHGVLCIRVKQARKEWFDQTYNKLTGIPAPASNVEGNYYSVSPDDVEGSWDYFHVLFPAPTDSLKPLLSFPGAPERQIMWDQWGQFSKYNDRNYVLHLFKMGFRLGKGHEVDLIRANVQDTDSFDKGFFCEPATAA